MRVSSIEKILDEGHLLFHEMPLTQLMSLACEPSPEIFIKVREILLASEKGKSIAELFKDWI